MGTTTHTRQQTLRIRLYEVFSQNERQKLKLLVKTIKKLDFFAKMAIFRHFSAKKIHNFQFSHGYHYSHTLVDTQEKTLGSFQPKLMTKIEVISQKPSKNWIFWQKWPFFDTFWPKKSPIFNFHTGTTTRTRQQTLRRRLQEVFSQN